MYVHMSVLVYIHTCVLLCICTYVKGCKFVVAPTYCILYNAYCIFVWTYIRTYICTYVHTYLECMHVCCFLYVRVFIFVMCFVRMPIYALVFCGSISVVCSELLQGLHSQHGAPQQRLLQGKWVSLSIRMSVCASMMCTYGSSDKAILWGDNARLHMFVWACTCNRNHH